MRLRFRLPLYFFLVIALGALSSYLLVRRSAEDAFRSYVFEGDAAKARVYAVILSEFLVGRTGWGGAQGFLADLPRLAYRMVDERIHGPASDAPIAAHPYETIRTLVADRIVVADVEGRIVADTAGLLLETLHPAAHLEHGVPVMVDFERRGTVLVGSMVDSSLSGVEEDFLGSVGTAQLAASAAAGGFALVLGLLLAATVARPLASLNAAVRKVASGELGAKVEIGGGDEIAELSVSFNAMSHELARLDEARRRVIADAAHELRTPVALIRGTIEAMLDGIYPLDRSTLASVHEETLRLARIIDTLRELESLDSGTMELGIEEVDTREILRQASALCAPAASDKGLELRLEGGTEPPAIVRADPARLVEVVLNLVSNAIRYVPEGGLIRLAAAPDGKGWCLVSVDDSGPGIPVEERRRVFERFHRLDPSRSAMNGGRGLGLAIAYEIAKAHGGSIYVEDSELGGARFVLRLPVRGPGPSAQASVSTGRYTARL